MSNLTFLNASLFPWLLALGVPVAIHLLTRRTRNVTVLPTFQFLQRSIAQQSRLFRMRQRLLLLLRLLALLFLVLAFLKPTLTAPLARNQGEKRAVVLLLDTSLSMAARRGGVSSLERARGQALALMDDLRNGDVANVILFGSTPRPVLAKLEGEFGNLRQALQTAEATAERGDPSSAMGLALEQLLATDTPRKELIIASDFQSANWNGVAFESLPQDVRLVLLNSDAEERENAAVTGLRLRPAQPQVGEEANAVAEVWNGSPTPRTLTVTLTAQRDGATDTLPAPPPQTVSVPAFASATVTFPLTFPDPARYRLTAKLPPDALPADDTRYRVADLRRSLNVALLTDQPLNGGTGAYFLARALNPSPERAGGVRVVPTRAEALTAADLKTFDLVFWYDMTTLPADKLPLIAQYVKAGGTLIVFLAGDRIVSQLQALAQQAPQGDGLPFTPQARLDVTGVGKGYVTITKARYDSPLLKLFQDPAVADLGKARFTRYFITGQPDTRAEILLEFEGGAIAAGRRSYGSGSVLLCNFTPAPEDSDLARQEIFPPLLHEFMKGLTAREGAGREFYVGSPATVTLDAPPGAGAIRAVDPNGELMKATGDPKSVGVVIERTAAPGFHTVVAGVESATVAVNSHPDESDLRPVNSRELELRTQERRVGKASAGRVGGAAELERLRRGVPLWQYCLLLALVALTLEHLVAVFGNRLRLRPERSP